MACEAIMYLLDTNTVSYIARERLGAARLRARLSMIGEAACISAITEAELLFGLARRPGAIGLATVVLSIVRSVRVLSWRSEEAVIYGSLRARMEARGTTLAALDMLIAAHALTLQAVLVTSDKAFSQVPGLIVENWAADL